MMYLVVDIETIPIRFKEEKIVKYQIEKKIDWHFHPAFSKIIAIGVKPENEEAEVFAENKYNESEILKKFWDYLKEKRPNLIVTFNGYKFDIPFIEARSYFNNIPISMEINKNRWQMKNSNHFDCLLLLLGMNEDFSSIPLVVASLLLNIEIPEDYHLITGKDIEKEYHRGNWEGIINHCKQDLILTEKIYLKISPLICKNQENELATEKQINFILKIAKEKGIPISEEEVKNWLKREASNWIDKHK